VKEKQNTHNKLNREDVTKIVIEVMTRSNLMADNK